MQDLRHARFLARLALALGVAVAAPLLKPQAVLSLKSLMMMKKNLLIASMALSAGLGAQAQTAPVKVEGAWARASVANQSGTGAFMTLTASEPVSLVAVRTPAAGVADVHEMKMEGDVMRMRPAGPVPLAPGKPFELKPGGYHIMMMELKAALKPGSRLPLTLVFHDAKGAERRLELTVPVATAAPKGAAAMDHGAHGTHKH